jgi:hypothetical protein
MAAAQSVTASIAARETELAAVRESIAQTSEALRGLRAREAEITEELITLKHQVGLFVRGRVVSPKSFQTRLSFSDPWV